MNRRQARQFELNWKQAHSKYERKIYAIFKKALDTQIKSVVDSVKENGVFLLSGFLPSLIGRETMFEAYRNAYEYIGIQHGKFTTDWMTELEDNSKSRFKFKMLAFGSEFWRGQMRDFLLVNGGTKVAELNSTTISLINKTLSNPEFQLLTISEQATKLVQTLSSPEYNRNRALRIARTESTIASNYVAKQAGENAPYRTNKVWIAKLDDRVRTTHLANHLVEIPMNEKFTVGAYQMDRPGDDSLGAGPEEIVQCRCVLSIVPVFGENGLPVPK